MNKSIPPVCSSTAISTETPQTIMMMPHGIDCTAARSLPAPASSSSDAAAKAENPRFSLKITTPAIHRAIAASVVSCIRLNAAA